MKTKVEKIPGAPDTYAHRCAIEGCGRPAFNRVWVEHQTFMYLCARCLKQAYGLDEGQYGKSIEV